MNTQLDHHYKWLQYLPIAEAPLMFLIQLFLSDSLSYLHHFVTELTGRTKMLLTSLLHLSSTVASRYDLTVALGSPVMRTESSVRKHPRLKAQRDSALYFTGGTWTQS